MHIYMITGTPRSGLNLFSQCLNILGIKPLTQKDAADADTINQLLFQDLGVSPYSPALPKGWMESDAAHKARGRIDKLLSSVDKLQLTISTPLTLKLWQQAFEVDTKYILMLRHPWETTQSMATNHNLDIQSGHILWLAHTRAALRALEGQDYSLVTYDQLLADPVTTLNSFLLFSPNNNLPRVTTPEEFPKGLHWGEQITINSAALLDFVQPSLKHHHASALSEADKKTYEPYARIYSQIRSGQKLEDNDYGITDTLLQALSFSPPRLTTCPVKQLDKSSRRGLTGDYRYTDNRPSQLTATISIPSTKGLKTESFHLVANQWQKITAPISNTASLRDNHIKLHPLNTHGTVSIASIALVNRATKEEIWTVNSGKEVDILEIKGAALKFPDHNNLTLLVTGTEAQVVLPAFLDLQDIPVDFIVWIKPVSDQQAILEKYNVHWSKKPDESVKVPAGQDPVIMELEVTLPDNNSILVPFATNKRQHLRFENGILHFSIPENEPVYLYSKENGNFSTVPEIDFFSLYPDTQYTVSGYLHSKGSIMFWAIEYDNNKRISHQISKIENDFFELHFQTDNRHHSLCLALRLYSEGYIDLKEHSLNVKRIHADTLSATLKKQTDELELLKKSLENKVSKDTLNAARQLEAHLAVQHYLQTGQTIEEMHGWAISPDLARYLIDSLESNHYDLIIEFGSGVSTALMARVLANKSNKSSNESPSEFIAFEHLEKYHQKTLGILKKLHLSKYVNLALAPLTSYNTHGQIEYPFYDCDEYLKAISSKFDSSHVKIFVFVDGPPASTGKYARYPAMPAILNHFPESQIDLLLDDYIRDDEKEIVAMWKKELEDRSIPHLLEVKKFEKEACFISVNVNK
jgi:hypothetical protein